MTGICLYLILFRHKLRIRCKRILYLKTVMSWSRKGKFLAVGDWVAYTNAIVCHYAFYMQDTQSTFWVPFWIPTKNWRFFSLKNIMNCLINYFSMGTQQFVGTKACKISWLERNCTGIWRGNKLREQTMVWSIFAVLFTMLPF